MKKLAIAVALAALFIIPMPGGGSAALAATPKTLDNLQAAFNGESNAHARYVEFAKKAEAEGFGPVASLFQAAARAEEIHAANHAVVIKSLGGVPKATIEKVVVSSTKENLEASIKGESYERDTMYPEFIATAKQEGQRDALKSFNYAKTAEAEHAKYYTDSVKNLATLKGAKVTYYVCTVCGSTKKDLNFEKCLSCFNPKDKYVAVS